MNTLIILLAGLLPTYVIRFSVLGIPTNVFEVAVLVVLLASLCVPRTRKQIVDSVNSLPNSFKIWILLFIVSALISTAYSPVLRSSLGILKGWIIIPIIFGLLIRTANIQKSIRSLIYSGLIVALLGISQIHGFDRVSSLYDVPNSLALFLVPVFILAFWIGVKKKNCFYQLASLVMLIAIIATQSFGAIIALMGTSLISILATRFTSEANPLSFITRRQAGYIGIIFFIIFALFFITSGRLSYLISPLTHLHATNSVTVRLQLWDIGIRLISKHPIVGVGLGQFEGAYQAELHHLFFDQERGISSPLYLLQPEYVFRDPHNWIISFWLNLGLLGLVSFIALNFLAIKYVRSIPDNVHARAALLALVSILLVGLFDTVYWKNDLSTLWWIIVFICIPQARPTNIFEKKGDQ